MQPYARTPTASQRLNKNMRLHGLARVKNEADVIEEFVRHNLCYLDALTVIDNASFDGTARILEALRAEGLPVRILHDETLPKRQSEIMTRTARQSAAEFNWDFLFLLDADEFLRVASRDALEESLAALSPLENGLIPWTTYVPTEHDRAEQSRVLDRICHRRLTEVRPGYHKCVIARGFATGREFEVGQGNHVVYDASGAAQATAVVDVALAHFPVRSIAQIQGKALLGWGAYLAMGHESEGLGWHQRRLFKKLESAPTWTADEVYDIALHYAGDGESPNEDSLTYDPLPAIAVCRYENATLSSMQSAAGYVRQLAGALARCETTAQQ